MDGYDLDRKSGTSNLLLSSQDTYGYSCGNLTHNHPYNRESILALHQLLNKQVGFTQGNNRAKVQVVANHLPKYLLCKLSSFRLSNFFFNSNSV